MGKRGRRRMDDVPPREARGEAGELLRLGGQVGGEARRRLSAAALKAKRRLGTEREKTAAQAATDIYNLALETAEEDPLPPELRGPLTYLGLKALPFIVKQHELPGDDADTQADVIAYLAEGFVSMYVDFDRDHFEKWRRQSNELAAMLGHCLRCGVPMDDHAQLPLHDADCPMTNSTPVDRTTCVCELEPGGHEAVRDTPEGGGGVVGDGRVCEDGQPAVDPAMLVDDEVREEGEADGARTDDGGAEGGEPDQAEPGGAEEQAGER